MRRSRSQSGETQMSCLFGLVLMIAAIFLAYKLVPIKSKAAEMRDTVANEGKSAGTHTDDIIRKAILKTAEDKGLEVYDEDITINRTGNLINIDVEYVTPVTIFGKTWNWKHHHHTENPIM